MKLVAHGRIAGLLIIAWLIASCDGIYFAQPMPHEGEALRAFPEELHGLYREVRSNDTLFVAPNFLRYGHWKSFVNFTYTKDVVVKPWRDYYIFNFREDSTSEVWMVFIAQWSAKDSTLLVRYFAIPPNPKGERRLSMMVSKLTYTGKHPKQTMIEPTSQWIVHLTDKEFDELLKNWPLDTAFIFRRLPNPTSSKPRPPRHR